MTRTIGQAFDQLFGADVPVRFSAYDGSTGGDPGAEIGLRLENERGLRYLVTAPGSLGMARAYLMNDLTVEGAHPGDPYGLLKLIEDHVHLRRPSPTDVPELARTVGLRNLRVPELPPQETPTQLHRLLNGLRHSKSRDAEAIHHHYDVGNDFYELLLGPSMTYTCSCYPQADATLEEAQANKYDLVCRKLDLRPGMRLLDVGCGWGGMVRHAVTHYGVTALGVTLSRDQADWAAKRIASEGLSGQAEVRHMDYRDVTERGFDAISSIGLTEHIGVKNYPSYFRFLLSRLRDGGRLLNHCITRPDNQHPGIPSTGFINRYVFPDGELTGSGHIIGVMQDIGFEVRHEENLREHYAMTCRDWVRNLREHWDEAVDLVGEGRAKVWALYLAGSRLSFERNRIQLHQVLGVRVDPDGDAHMPLRPTWAS
ncbi:MAG TPA: cyclopropane-fatty-acyl-phospholipid synthase family protein [Segeticoccus sp.]|nr:cyclopropane-fatty-acyl-phospholipid synthase family protein [Segeticoccus sp.]